MKKFFTLVLFAAIFLFKPFFSHAQAANVDDSLALVDLYNSTDGPNWTNNGGWLKGPVNTWNGVLLDNFPGFIGEKVYSLYLLGNGLTGTLPSSMANLTKLVSLTLSYNQLKGTIPSALGNLNNLNYIDLSANYFTGNIPISLNNLTYLSCLFLSFNLLSSDTIPTWLSNHTYLQRLDLSGDSLKGNIPMWLGTLPNLYELDLSRNQLSGSIPSSLGNNDQLLHLYLDYNQLSGSIPTSIGNDTTLFNLGLSHNQLSGAIPSTLTNIPVNNFFSSFLINDNHFTFNGMELIVSIDTLVVYSPQYPIPLRLTANKLSVSAGGTLTNNTYKWYKGDTLIATVSADSTYKPTAAGNYWVAVTNSIATKLTLYSDTIVITNAELPIIFLSITAQPTHNGNLLQWQTATEINSAYFNVQRSADGVRFTNIAQVNAAGNSSTIQSYQYTDALSGLNPVPPTLFYRLQEADKDGDVTYSKIIKLDNNTTPQVTLSIFPNPVHEVLNVQLAGITGAATLLVTDASGKTLQTQEVNAVDGQTIGINTQALAAGIYFVQVLNGKQGFTQKFVKK